MPEFRTGCRWAINFPLASLHNSRDLGRSERSRSRGDPRRDALEDSRDLPKTPPA